MSTRLATTEDLCQLIGKPYVPLSEITIDIPDVYGSSNWPSRPIAVTPYQEWLAMSPRERKRLGLSEFKP